MVGDGCSIDRESGAMTVAMVATTLFCFPTLLRMAQHGE